MKKNKAENEAAIDEFVQRKLTRLEKFYRYGLSHAGWNKYSYINVEFDNQIICKRKPSTNESQEEAVAEEYQNEATE